MREVVLHVLLALAILALGGSALRIVTRVAPAGLERAIATLVVAVALAIGEALALGLVSLGSSPIALSLAAGATWAATRALPAPATPLGAELSAWWGERDLVGRAVTVAAAGALLAWVAWLLRYPSIGFDSSVYHYPDIAGWIVNGKPGSQLFLSYDIPYGNYPLTDEVAQTWAAAIARSWVPISLWNPLMLVALVGAGWVTLRNLSVPRHAAALATAAFAATPLVVRQLNEPQTDLPALAWLACTAALATGAGRRPALLVPALVAAGLALGTKATVAPEAVLALGYGAWLAREQLRPLAGWLALGFAGAFVVGGIWYVRNIAQHGSPFWPFVAAPWGDDSPYFLGLIDQRFIDRPLDTLDGREGTYSSLLGGGWIALLGGLWVLLVGAFAPLRDRRLRRTLLAAGGLAVLGTLIWSASWGTGLQTAPQLPTPAGWPISTIRYLLPAVALALTAVALATRVPGRLGQAATGVLVLVLGWSLVADFRLGSPYTPSLFVFALGALAGLALLFAARLVPRLPRPPAWACAVVIGALLAPVSNGYVERSIDVVGSTAPGPGVLDWFVDQPGFGDDDWKIAISSRAVLGPLAGDHFTHELELVPAHGPCSELRRIPSHTRLIVSGEGWWIGLIGLNSYNGPRCMEGVKPTYVWFENRIYAPEGAARAPGA
ncbi:MAG TPA: hypothetical protein VH741_12440 [Candidatus Limnocylindrales bacterium]